MFESFFARFKELVPVSHFTGGVSMKEVKEVAMLIRCVRELAGISLAKAAEMIGVSPRSLYKYETGDECKDLQPAWVIARICDNYGTDYIAAKYCQHCPMGKRKAMKKTAKAG